MKNRAGFSNFSLYLMKNRLPVFVNLYGLKIVAKDLK